MLSRDAESVFDFKSSIGFFSENYIKYEVGVGLTSRKKETLRTIKLSGKWNFKEDIGLFFEVVYENDIKRAIVFGADAKLTENDTISFRLKNDIEDKDIGIDLELSHDIFKGDGEALLKILASKRESAIYVGAARRW